MSEEIDIRATVVATDEEVLHSAGVFARFDQMEAPPRPALHPFDELFRREWSELTFDDHARDFRARTRGDVQRDIGRVVRAIELRLRIDRGLEVSALLQDLLDGG